MTSTMCGAFSRLRCSSPSTVRAMRPPPRSAPATTTQMTGTQISSSIISSVEWATNETRRAKQRSTHER
eukprot:scaffold83043_cov57-Phaeocystis_antarctica.AAC.5